MVVAMVVLGVVGLVVVIGAALAFGRLMQKEHELEEKLHEPQTPTVRFLVPAGVDPAVVGAALLAAGFRNVLEMDYGEEALLIECTPEERERVRAVISEVEDRECLPAVHVPEVRFMDEAA